MTAQRGFGMSIVLALVLVARLANAQVLTGTLFGTVRDESGGVLPSATVRLTSPALISGPASTVTNERGQFRFVLLAAGEYALDVELASFARYQEDPHFNRCSRHCRAIGDSESWSNRRIDFRSRRNKRRPAPKRLLESFWSGSAQRDSSSTLQHVRFDSSDAGRVAHLRFERRRSQRVRLRFERERESVSAGWHQLHVPVLRRSTATARRRRHPGGSRRLDRRVRGIRQHPGWCVQCCDQARRKPFRTGLLALRPARQSDQPSGRTPLRSLQRTDDRIHPRAISRPHNTSWRTSRPNRAWFFGGYQYLRDSDSQPGTDPLFPRSSKYDKAFGKVTWQINQRMKWMSSFHDEFWTNPQRPTLAQPFPTTLVQSGTRPTGTFGQLTDTLTNNTLLDVRVSRFAAPGPTTRPRETARLPTMWIWQPEFKAAARRDSVPANWNGRRSRRASASTGRFSEPITR